MAATRRPCSSRARARPCGARRTWSSRRTVGAPGRGRGPGGGDQPHGPPTGPLATSPGCRPSPRRRRLWPALCGRSSSPASRTRHHTLVVDPPPELGGRRWRHSERHGRTASPRGSVGERCGNDLADSGHDQWAVPEHTGRFRSRPPSASRRGHGRPSLVGTGLTFTVLGNPLMRTLLAARWPSSHCAGAALPAMSLLALHRLLIGPQLRAVRGDVCSMHACSAAASEGARSWGVSLLYSAARYCFFSARRVWPPQMERPRRMLTIARDAVSELVGPEFGEAVSAAAHAQVVDNFGLANCDQDNRNNP